MAISTTAVAGTCIAFSFTLFGNAVTQTFMGVPAVIVDFPPPSSPEHAARARLLGRQWPVFWAVGNRFFRPISTIGLFGYAYTSWASASQGPGGSLGGWGPYAVSALCHLVTVVHSALNMMPLNEKLNALGDPGGSADPEQAESYARQWIRFNIVRVVMPAVAGSVALFQILRKR
ncbi:hypothetical protein GGS23DRAFT_599388 [Durotheca rogersii]|uniref:uncharacterized protein n=1 Tax=Durotheca rogersii TaxID=419775 RepID=UPI00221F61B4|nr:uncharacterized protein GGS23DRAFT_599388 [Durotheca rogersii]KAI5860580.1 hypothetical protein GGS23DRAFT_599388 [Durotheca rogersii]